MARMKVDENQLEVRTHALCKTRGGAVDRREILIELGNSWFSSKYI